MKTENSSESDTPLTISSRVDIASHSKIRFLHSCLTLLPHTAEADTHSHQLICALVNLHYLRLSIERFSRIPPLARSTIGNPRMILIRFKEPSEEFRVKNG